MICSLYIVVFANFLENLLQAQNKNWGTQCCNKKMPIGITVEALMFVCFTIGISLCINHLICAYRHLIVFPVACSVPLPKFSTPHRLGKVWLYPKRLYAQYEICDVRFINVSSGTSIVHIP